VSRWLLLPRRGHPWVLNWVTTMRDTAHTLGSTSSLCIVRRRKSGVPYAYIPADDQKLLQLFHTVDGVFDEGGFTSGNLQATVKWLCAHVTFNWNYNLRQQDGDQNRWSNSPATCSRYKPGVNLTFSKNATPGPGNLLTLRNPNHSPKRTFPGHLPPSWCRGARHRRWRGRPFTWRKTPPVRATTWELVPYGGPLYMALNPPIGHPCQDPQTPQVNVFTRQFSGGLVMVNAINRVAHRFLSLRIHQTATRTRITAPFPAASEVGAAAGQITRCTAPAG